MESESKPIIVPVELDTTKLDRYLQHIKEERELEREENLYKKTTIVDKRNNFRCNIAIANL